ncbi:MAG: hypothetical protein ABWZ75_08300 [Novosphingobium sp.]
MPLVRRPLSRGFGNRWALLTGVLIGGVLGASIVLTQRNNPGVDPGQGARPLPRVVAQVENVPRPTPVVQPRIVGTIAQSNLARDAAPDASAVVKSRPVSAPVTHKSKDRPKQRLAETRVAKIPRSRDGSCGRLEGMDLATCMRPQILDADRQLRTAYNDAVRAGVDRRVLANYRRQWSSLRKLAVSDPRDVSLGYRDIAQQLDARRTGQSAEF